MTETWSKGRLDDLCFVEYGTRVVQKIDGGSKYPVYGGGGATFHMDISNRKDQLIVSRFAMSEECVRFVDGDFFLNDSGLTVSTRNQDTLLQRYLDYHLLYLNNQIYSLGKGAAQRNLDVPAFRNLEIHYPRNLATQKAIVEKLDIVSVEILSSISMTQKNIENFQSVFQSFLLEIFKGNEIDSDRKSLKEISIDFGRGKSKHRPRNDPTLYGGPYPFIQTGEVRSSGYLIDEFSQTYSEKGLAQSKLWPKGTICITIAANIAEVGVINFDSCFPDSIIGIVVDPKQATNEYVYFMLLSAQAVLKAKGKGSAQDNINLGTFEGMTFPFPSLSKQDEMVGKLRKLSSQVDESIEVCREKLEELGSLRRAILSKTFSSNL